MTAKEVRDYLGQDWDRVEALLAGSLRSSVKVLDRTNASLLANGGKMLRPMLALLAGRACGGVSEDGIRVAVASELLHNATLLHDDVLDDGRCRRGAPTVLSTLGAKPSVLIGDFWLVRTMTTLLGCGKHFRELLELFSLTEQDLVEGELLQMQKASSGDTSEEDYMRIIDLKTASLFRTVCAGAVIAADAPAALTETFREYGRLLGLAFQIKDDIMDYEGGPMGKPSGTDLREGKITLPLLGALGRADAPEAEQIRRFVSEMPENPGNCAAVADFVRSLDGTGYARQRLDYYIGRAKETLGVLPESQAREFLMQLADYCAYRQI